MRIHIEKIRLKLRESFAIAHGTFDRREGLIIGLEEDGCIGWGEAVAIDYYGYSIDSLVEAAKGLLDYWNEREFPGVRAFYVENKKRLGGNPFVLSAFDCAAHDLAARRASKPWREWIGWEMKADIPPTSRTIGLKGFEQMKQSIEHWSDWPALKIKFNETTELEFVERILGVGSTPLRIDANGSWSVKQVEQAMSLDASLPLELIEQPLARGNDEDLNGLQNRRLPILADESFQNERDLTHCFRLYDGVNLKLMKCGGLTPAIELIKEIKENGLSVMIGCMTESSFGITAAAQLASGCDYVDLDGALLLENDPANGVHISKGKISLPPGNGFGTRWSE